VVPLQSRNQRFDLENNNFSRDPLTSTWKGWILSENKAPQKPKLKIIPVFDCLSALCGLYMKTPNFHPNDTNLLLHKTSTIFL
jgi:hypothetical protein